MRKKWFYLRRNKGKGLMKGIRIKGKGIRKGISERP
jgi:hypothetical protein